MSIILTLLGLLALFWFFGVVFLARKKQWVTLGLLIAGTLGGLAFMFRPVCMPIENGEQQAAQYYYSER